MELHGRMQGRLGSGVVDCSPDLSPSQAMSLSYTLHGWNAQVLPKCAEY